MKSYFFALLSALALCASSFGAEAVRVSCVGDSITAGHGIKNPAQKYPQRLGAILGAGFDVRNFGVSGTTLLSKGDFPYVNTNAYKNALAFNPNIVVIKLGTNDTKPQNWKFAGEFKANLNALIDSFKALKTNPKIYLCYPCPLYSLNSGGINEDRIFNGVIPVIREVAKERGIAVIDMHSALSDRPEFFPDRLHPNEDGANLMAWTVAKKLLKDLTPKAARD